MALRQSLSVVFGYAILAAALPVGGNGSATKCRDIRIPVTVEVPRFLISTRIQDDWDAVALSFNLTQRNSPSAITGTTAPVKSIYDVGATFCGNGSTTLILTHGILESKSYWQPDFPEAEKYDFVSAAVNAGYSVLSYDRIGVGSSSKIDSLMDAQFQVHTAVLNALIERERSQRPENKIALVGHSYGAYLSAATAALSDQIDGVVLMGFGGSFKYFGPFVAGSGLRIAKFRDEERWGTLDAGWLTTVDKYADTYIYFGLPGDFEHRAAEWTHARASEPFGIGEIPSLTSTAIEFGDIETPVLLLQGRYDLSACGGDCVGELEAWKGNLTGSPAVEVVEDLPAGHNINLHLVAPKAFSIMFDFLKRNGL
ncbi:hypothetical protein MCOR27_006307 [Pyricularia oryzae]|uniref:AB hydrolase-1 domain-containing protein n=4 Tax=Pyricularia TaxID=48558 RepID=A0ABQ8N5S2_PYRGI|nr:hypothetical protein OOU_Y34scaffold00370g15 [Pyricularia oryzae Y34]KAH8844477.1 hypothetical protein MCOR01_005213 [Pyricularia oryzae]KAI6290832.1 hypothetical protein MCOR33_011019 [Pyricularia grisea]KAH9427587.1 hypothetical protein MCOR02_011826 [Pyricularia oryzae]KAI6255540.1 hypothetical protein MCOR19_007989 [Pyricularia oryzae]